MTEWPITVDPAMSLAELESRFIAEGIYGAPVVSEGQLVGVVSRSDIVRASSEERERAEDFVSEFYHELPTYRVSARNLILRESDVVAQRLAELAVHDVMSTRVIAVSPEESAEQVARCMLSYRIHRVLVTERDELRGIISSLDMVQLVAEPEHARGTPSEGGAEVVCLTPDIVGEPSALLPGDATVATLRDDSKSGATTLLVRLPPGGRIEAQVLFGEVQHFVLSGQYESEGTQFRAGTYRLVPKGEVPAITSHEGAVFLLIYDAAPH
jgi:CBS domain-containing protein